MAIVISNSDIVTAFVNKQRIRTMNYHGSVTNTVVVDTSTWASSDVDSILYLTLVPYGAVLKSIKVAFSADHTELAYTVGIAGINPDRTLTAIKDDLITVDAPSEKVDANTILEQLPATLWGSTLYQQLCAPISPYTPIDAFKEYKDNEYGVLFLKSTTANDDEIDGTMVSIDWVDPSPSETPKINKTINVLNARELYNIIRK